MRRGDFELLAFTAGSDRVAVRQLLNTLLPYGALWAAASWARPHAPWLLPPLLALLVLFLARCFSLMHDCGHGSLFRSPAANRLVGFLLGVVSGIPQLPWSRGHAFHHRHNGDWQSYTGPAAVVSTEAFDRLSPARRRLYGWIRQPLMLLPGGFFYLVIKPRLELLLGLVELVPEAVALLQQEPTLPFSRILERHRSRRWHSPEEFRDLLLNNLAVIVLWLGMAQVLGAGPFWLLYAPVMTGAAALFLCIFFVQHNFPGSYAEATAGWSAMAGALEGTSELELPPWLNWFSADIGCHAIHHLCSAIPNYRLREAQERNAHLLRGVTRLSLGTIPACFAYILWDPAAGRLTTLEAHAHART